MTDPRSLDPLRGRFFTGEFSIATPDCLDADTIAALADGTISDPSRSAALRHIARCTVCRRAVASVKQALDEGPITHEVEVVEGRRGRFRIGPLLRVAVPIAAAAGIAVVLWVRTPTGQSVGSVLRDSAVTATATPRPIVPRDHVSGVAQFVWSALPRATRYRVRLYTDDGAVLWTRETSDTLIAAPATPALAPDVSYLWMVEAQTEWQRWTASDLVEFRIVPSPR